MRKTKEFERLWCHKDFKRLIKVEASKRGLNIKDYTKQLAANKSLMEEFSNDGKKWNFKI